MIDPKFDESADAICGIVSDFRSGEIEQLTPKDVHAFVAQCDVISPMTSSEKRLFVAGLKSALASSYWSRDKIRAEMDQVIPGVRSDDVTVLFLQEHRSSQGHLLGVLDADAHLDNTLDIGRTITLFVTSPATSSHFDSNAVIEESSSTTYLYIDDATYTGKTLASYLVQIKELMRNRILQGKRLVVWHLVEFQDSARLLIDPIVELMREMGVSVELTRVRAASASVGGVSSVQVLLPRQSLRDNVIVERLFLRKRDRLKAVWSNPESWRMIDVKDDGLFERPEQRDVVERVLLEVGCYLIIRTKEWNSLMRPLGFVSNGKDQSLGFGSFFCTCFNSSNNSPLALWWGDPKMTGTALANWKPLLPRRV